MKSVKLNIIIYIVNLIMVAIGNNGNKIGNDGSGNLIIQTLSGKFLELSSNEIRITGEISSNYLNTKFSIIETIINSYANKSLFEDLSENFYTLENSFNSLNFDSTNISGDFVSEASFNELQNRGDNFFFFFKLKPW